jgi:hypothetical protein
MRALDLRVVLLRQREAVVLRAPQDHPEDVHEQSCNIQVRAAAPLR